MIRLRYISLFSGIEAASVAWEPLGWEPVAFSEIEPFPCAVLAERFPDVPNLGDVNDMFVLIFVNKDKEIEFLSKGELSQKQIDEFYRVINKYK